MTAVQTEAVRRHEGSIRRATLLTGLLVAGGTLLGFLRDLVMAHRFGASSGTDAFLVAWTIPETVSPLLIEDAMALLMVPIVTRLLREPDGVRPLVTTVLPRLVTALSAATIVLILAAPLVVGVLAPGLDDPGPAARCVRLTALTVLAFGIAGFMSATLRAHHHFGPPAAIYLAYNVGILAMIAALAAPLGITSAALGVACGGLLMIVVQAPAFVRCLRSGPGPAAPPGVSEGPDGVADRGTLTALTLAAAAPIVIYTLTRQSQVFIERFLGSGLAAGSISHLNYAQKVGQVPMVASLLLVTVTFPRLARASAGGDLDEMRRRLETDLVIVSAVVLWATACLTAFAPLIVELLFQHGRFTEADGSRTALVLRVYVLGVWGQAMMGVTARAFFAGSRPVWHPVRAMAAGLAVTAVAGSTLVALAGTTALAAANAAGITVAALLLLAAMRKYVAPVSLRAVGGDLGTLLTAAGLACLAGLAVTGTGLPAFPRLLAGLTVVTAVYAVALLLAAHGRTRATGPLSPLVRVNRIRHKEVP
ncbi:murein biosynthesis integral membrane protein MurJ [Actinomadura sp. 9N407]|uniref:murein biosynthesis integral membrane protein MurJ n=1 Tax=Actinomadura sp. 9N407 TaxID=3375154 RepID=UPI0037B9CAB9